MARELIIQEPPFRKLIRAHFGDRICLMVILIVGTLDCVISPRTPLLKLDIATHILTIIHTANLALMYNSTLSLDLEKRIGRHNLMLP